MAAPAESASVGSPNRRRPLACLRCRRRKVRCDGASPACSNCVRARTECFEGKPDAAISRSRLHFLENRVRELETNEAISQAATVPGQTRQPDALASQEPSYEDSRVSDFQSQFQSQILPNQQQHPLPQQQTPLQPQQTDYRPSSIRRLNPTPSHGRRMTEDAPHEAAIPSPAGSSSSQITRDNPIAHEVGLLSLANATDPKYLGPSSGVTFARLIYESVPQSQGLPLSHQATGENEQTRIQTVPEQELCDIQQSDFPSMTDCQQYAEVYFSVSALYPFISQEDFYFLFNEAYSFSKTSKWSCRLPLKLVLAQIFLVLSIGARLLEVKLGNKFPTRDLFDKGMKFASQLKLYESIEGVQILLLLAQHSLHCPEGLNAWHLVHTIIASCLDLGLQRRDNAIRDHEAVSQRKIRHLRSAVFWSAYSMDRTLTTILGRPLTLRDEAIDREFPGCDDNSEVEEGATQWNQSNMGKLPSEYTQAPYTAFIYSLRFDRITAEIKLMLYRVSRSPKRFPWPQDMLSWQREVHNACVTLMEEAQGLQRGNILNSSGALSGVMLQRLELKFHHCMMLLNRPSPQNPHPSWQATQTGFTSAMGTIATYNDLHRFSNMDSSWLSAHSIFVAAITIVYCLWSYPFVRDIAPLEDCINRVEQALHLLTVLGQSWSVALEACNKLSRLVQTTREFYEAVGEVPGPDGQRSNVTMPWMEGNGGAARPLVADMGGDRSATNMAGLDGRNTLIDELGILRDLFDLGWLDDFAPENDQSFEPSMSLG